MSENLRVLYVAITRAKDYLISFSTFSDAEGHINSLSKKLIGSEIPSAVVKKVQNDADLLLLCALIHPNGAELRGLCENRIEPVTAEPSKLCVNIYKNDVNVEEETLAKAHVNEDLLNKISERLSYEYFGSELSGYASKRTASSLDVKEQSYKFFASKVPSFITGGELTGSAKGTAMHSFMQYCNYENALNDLESEIERLADCGYITETQVEALDRNKLEALFNSELAKRMFSSEKLYRELKVSSFVPLNRLENTDLSEPVMVQGIADCVFEEDGKLVLVDYKTDRVSSEEELLELYKNQIGFYRDAVSKTLKMPVKEAMLYSFSLGKCCVYK